jgi:hypothetical protein
VLVELPEGAGAPVVPVVSVGLVAPGVVTSLPASAARARGGVSARRPWAPLVALVSPGAWLGVVRFPVALPPLSLQALAPAIRAAAEAKVIHLRSVIVGVLSCGGL